MLMPIFDHSAHICHFANKLPNLRPESLLREVPFICQRQAQMGQETLQVTLS